MSSLSHVSAIKDSKNRCRIWLWIAAFFFAATAIQAQTTITLTKTGGNVVVSINGTPAFSVYRSTRPDFSFDGVTLASGLGGSSYTDVNATLANSSLYCYDVVEVGDSPPVGTGGGNPQPDLVITLLTPNSGKEGDSVTISGTGFAQFYPENLVTFNGKPVVVTASGSGTITTTVPVGATTGSVQVRVGRLASNPLSFTLSPVGALPNLSGIATNPSNFKLFVTDTGASPTTSLIELDPFSAWSKTIRGGFNNIRGPAYSARRNMLFYSDATKTMPDPGSPIGAHDIATQTSSSPWDYAGLHSQASCVALVASRVDNCHIFFADRLNQEIRRVCDGESGSFLVGN